MNLPARFFILSVAATVICTSSLADAAPVEKEEYDQQNENFKQWWGTDLVWKFDDLPTKAMIERRRLPYSGAIYPDKSGGTAHVLRKYDMAFNGRMLAVSFERYDIKIHKEEKRRGLIFRRTRRETPDWAGHCNGWTAAAIRHAEPENNVARNGVVFTPADIKGLLAELYVYSDSLFLGGVGPAVNPATFHVVLSNWLGRGSHPIGMDSTLGKEVWNYPIYAYTTTSSKRGNRNVEIKMNIGYVDYVNREFDRGPENFKFMYFHYMLDLDSQGNVVGGHYFGDSNRVDMLWAPLQPTQGGQAGNEEGNPHLNAKTVLALWRDSVPEEKRKNWFNIDPTEEDRQFNEREEAMLAEETRQAEEEAAAAEAATAEAGAAEETPVVTSEEAAEEATEETPAAAEQEEAPAEEPAAEPSDEASGEASETQ